MRILELLHHLNVIELDVEVLVHALQNALELDVVFELHGDLMVDERLEETNPKNQHPSVNFTCPLLLHHVSISIAGEKTHLKKSMMTEFGFQLPFSSYV